MPNLQYSITFEHDIKPTQTVRGDARTNDPHLALRRALNAIEQAHPRYQWSSFVVVIEKPRQKAGFENEPSTDDIVDPMTPSEVKRRNSLMRPFHDGPGESDER